MSEWIDVKDKLPELIYEDYFDEDEDSPNTPYRWSDDVLVMCLDEDNEIQFLVAHYYKSTDNKDLWEMWCPDFGYTFLEDIRKTVVKWIPIPTDEGEIC